MRRSSKRCSTVRSRSPCSPCVASKRGNDATARFALAVVASPNVAAGAAFAAIVAISLIALVARIVQIQIVDGATYRARALANRIRLIPVAAPRGIIADRYGEFSRGAVPRSSLG